MPTYDSANDAADAASFESANWRGVTIVSVHHDDSDHRSAVRAALRAAYPSSMEGDVDTATRATSLPFAQEASKKPRVESTRGLPSTGQNTSET